MRISHITKSLLLSLVVLSCTARQENSTDKSAEADTKDKSPSQVEEFVRFIKTGGIDIPLKFYSLLRMDTAQDTDYAIAASAMNVEPMFVLLSKTAGCTDITCSLHYRAYNISTSEENKQTRVHFCGEFEEAFETNPPVYALSYGMFVLMEDTVHDWEESDSGAMSEVSEAYEKDYIYAYYNDRSNPSNLWTRVP